MGCLCKAPPTNWLAHRLENHVSVRRDRKKAGIIGLGLLVSTIFLEIILGERPDDLVYVLPGLKRKWLQKHANQGVGIRVIVQETPRVQFTLQDIQHEADIRLLNRGKLFIGPVSLKRLRFTPGEL